MAQDFSLRAPLIDGHGNFGSVDGDPPAAMRYTEARLAPIAMELLRDIDAETVDFVPNYDGYEQEPVVLPARFPNLLVNGAGGIAVGMATNIPPHNLGEVIDAVVHFIDHPECHAAGPHEVRQGPRLPDRRHDHGARRDQGRLRDRPRARSRCARWARSRRAQRPRQRIVVTELPYQVNKARLAEKIARPRQGRHGSRTSPTSRTTRAAARACASSSSCKRGANPQVVLNQLYKHTQLQDNFGVDHAGARRRRAAHAQPGRDDRLLRRPPGRRRHAAHASTS